MDNNKLYKSVVESLRFEARLEDSNIIVDIKTGGIVVLGGTVETCAEKHIVEEVVGKVSGVRGIANEIKVDISTKNKMNDVDIAEAALHSLKWTVLLPHKKVKVLVQNSKLTLIGEVNYYYQKRLAEEAVQNLAGITKVINRIEIANTMKAVDLKDEIREVFERHARIDADRLMVEIKGSEIILKGKLRNYDELLEAKEVARNTPGIVNVIATDLMVAEGKGS